MAALDRYDEWEHGIDALLAEREPTAAPELAELYDPVTLAGIDTQTEPAGRPASGWRGGVTAGAMVVGMVHGVRDVLDTDEDEPVMEIEEDRRSRRLEHVSVHLAWGAPAASIAIVRPWLAP